MALVHCPECNKSIADDAKECPNCGHPMETRAFEADPKPTSRSRHLGWGTFIYLIIIIAGVVMLFEGSLTGLLLLIIGIVLIIGRYKLWSKVGKKVE